MPWPVPDPTVIADNAARVYEARFPGIDARSGKTVASVAAETLGAEMFDNFLYQRYLADELMADTAVDNLQRLADMWGEPRRAPARAVGYGTAQGAPLLPVPAGLQAAAGDNTLFQVTVATQADANGQVTLPLAALDAGVAGNQVGGGVLTLVSPLAGLNPQTVTLDANGTAGGADAEDDDSLRARLLARIRRRGSGGDVADYLQWATEAGAAYVAVYGNWTNPGSLGVVVAMPGPAAATPAQVAAIQAAIDAVRPVTAVVTVVAAVLQPINMTIRLNPDTVTIRAAAANAYALWFVASGVDGRRHAEIGQPVLLSSLSAALQTTDGETSHTVVSPAADVVMARTALPVAGTLSFA